MTDPQAAAAEGPPPAELRRQLRHELYGELRSRDLLARLVPHAEAGRRELAAAVDRVLARRGLLLTSQVRQALRRSLVDEVLGHGPIEPLLQDPQVEEIMANGPDQLWVARRVRGGRVDLERTALRFDDAEHLLHVLDRILAPLGRRLDESHPRVDARLPDGSRVHAIIPPLAVDGPVLTLRKFPARWLSLEELVSTHRSLTPGQARFLEEAVQGRRSLLISGGTGSGKTTLLSALAACIPDRERIITIEETAELALHRTRPHVVRLEARPPNVEGRGAVPIRELVLNALRMRPDRIIVGECRGPEVVDMLQAMNTGHDGSLTTLHASSPRQAVARLENLVLMSGLDVPLPAVRRQIAMALDLIVQVERRADGTRRLTAIAEVVGMSRGQLRLRPVLSGEGDP